MVARLKKRDVPSFRWVNYTESVCHDTWHHVTSRHEVTWRHGRTSWRHGMTSWHPLTTFGQEYWQRGPVAGGRVNAPAFSFIMWCWPNSPHYWDQTNQGLIHPNSVFFYIEDNPKGVRKQKCNSRICFSNIPTFYALRMNLRSRIFFWSLSGVYPKCIKCWGVWNADMRIAFLFAEAFGCCHTPWK